MNIGTRIKRIRKELGLTVDQLAERIGKDRATIYRYENGEIENMPTTIIEPLAKALLTTPQYLMGWDEGTVTENQIVEARNYLFNIAGFIKGGVKTKAGKNRMIPIHSLIYPIIEERYNANSVYLIENESGDKMNLKTYHRYYWKPTLDKIGITAPYTPHFTRHTFRTKMDNAGVNKRVMDLIMGHSSRDVGDRVYNHKTLEQLKDGIELVTR